LYAYWVKNLRQANEANFEAGLPQSEREIEQVREQLERLLANPLFYQSRRYPALLRYAVEQTLLGNGDQIKERNIGIEVFGRDPNYDTNADPIVRSTASEVRKRLAQYYIDPAHSGELQIDLPSGSYVAVFHWTAHEPASDNGKEEKAVGGASADSGQSLQEWPTRQAAQVAKASRRPWRLVAWFVLCAMLTGGVGFCSGFWLLSRRTVSAQSRLGAKIIDQFWSIIINAPGIVTFCVGDSNRTLNQDSDQIVVSENAAQRPGNRPEAGERLARADLITLTHLAAALQISSKPYRISETSQATFSQLREGPIVLLGTFENPWIQRFTQDLRYLIQAQSNTASIVDRRNSAQARWTRPLNVPNQKLYTDYSIIARFHDSATGLPIVLFTGIDPVGTEAAGSLLSNPSDLAKLLQSAPGNWPSMNMEAVIETEIVDGFPGQPKIVAVEYW
jgi:hypothetical protein